MKVAAFVLLMFAFFSIRTLAQELVSTLSLTAEAGYLTNTYLHPVLPLWVAADAPFVGLAPTGSVAWHGKQSYAAFEGRLRLLELADRGGIWWMGGPQAHLRHRLHRRVAVGIDGSASRIEMGTPQWLAWLAPYLSLQLGSRLQLSGRGGLSYRRYDAAEDHAAFEQESFFGVAQLAFLSGGSWQASGHVYVTESAATDAAGIGGTLGYSLTPTLSLGAELAAEWFGSGASNRKASGYVEWTPTGRASWTAQFGVQRFDLEQSADFFAAAGFTYRLRHRKDLDPSRLDWIQHGDEVAVRYRYDDGGTLFIVGDFNDWRVGATRLERASKNAYVARLALEPGAYEYRIVAVEGGLRRWLPLPEDALTTDDEFGGTNGILIVE